MVGWVGIGVGGREDCEKLAHRDRLVARLDAECGRCGHRQCNLKALRQLALPRSVELIDSRIQGRDVFEVERGAGADLLVCLCVVPALGEVCAKGSGREGNCGARGGNQGVGLEGDQRLLEGLRRIRDLSHHVERRVAHGERWPRGHLGDDHKPRRRKRQDPHRGTRDRCFRLAQVGGRRPFVDCALAVGRLYGIYRRSDPSRVGERVSECSHLGKARGVVDKAGPVSHQGAASIETVRLRVTRGG